MKKVKAIKVIAIVIVLVIAFIASVIIEAKYNEFVSDKNIVENMTYDHDEEDYYVETLDCGDTKFVSDEELVENYMYYEHGEGDYDVIIEVGDREEYISYRVLKDGNPFVFGDINRWYAEHVYGI